MKLLNGCFYIPVSNLARSVEWYSKYFQFAVVFEDPLYVEMKSETGIRIKHIVIEEKINSHRAYSSGPQAAYGFVVAEIEKARQWLME